ncbi:MAG: hypothetical protein LBF40_05410 [Deltaproteobacteria bacterium]|jgi:hypothetical protein|nr:hypothetical protein [Deltaproteobacteria bacterium]
MLLSQIIKLEDRFYQLLERSQSPELARAVLVEEAERLERASAAAVGKGGAVATKADLFAKGGKNRLSQRLREAGPRELGKLAEELRKSPGCVGARPRPSAPGKAQAAALPRHVGVGERLAALYLGPLGLRIRNRQKDLLSQARGLYDGMRGLLRMGEGGDAKGPAQGEGLPDRAMWGLKGSVALAGARLMYFSAILGLSDFLWDLVMETHPVGAGPLVSEEQAIAWAWLIGVLAGDGQTVLAFAAMDKLKTLPPFHGVLRAISGSTVELIAMLGRSGRDRRERVKNRDVEEGLYETLQFIAPSLYQFEKAGIIPYVPADLRGGLGKDSRDLLRVGFLEGAPSLWAPFREAPPTPAGPLGRRWPFHGRSVLLDFHLDICEIAWALYSKGAVKPDMEEIEDACLKLVNLIDYYVTNPYRLKAAGWLTLAYGGFKEFEKAKFMHGVMMSINSREGLRARGEPGPIRTGTRLDTGEPGVFAEIKASTTMGLIDLFIAGRYQGAKEPKGTPIQGITSDKPRRGTPRGRRGPVKPVPSGEFPQAFDFLHSANPKLAKIRSLAKKGEADEAMALFLKLGDPETRDLPMYLNTASLVMNSATPALAKQHAPEILTLMFDRRYGHPYHKNYAAHNGLKMITHFAAPDTLPIANKILSKMLAFARKQRGPAVQCFSYGIARCAKDAERAMAPFKP